MVAARVADMATMPVPTSGPKIAPAVNVSGMAGTHSTSSPVYLHHSQSVSERDHRQLGNAHIACRFICRHMLRYWTKAEVV